MRSHPPKGHLLVPVTAYSNMETGYQATNPGFRIFLQNDKGEIIAAAPSSIEAVANGFEDDASKDSSFVRLVLNASLKLFKAKPVDGAKGKLFICMAQDTTAPMEKSACKKLKQEMSAKDRPFQYADGVDVTYTVKDNVVRIDKYHYTPSSLSGGSAYQLPLSTVHAMYAFAAPAKTYKDFQSPLVFDLSGTGKFQLIDVWDEKHKVEFDLNAEGKKVHTGWIGAKTGFLALDVNGNGRIDSGAELFGEHFQGTGKFPNGFEALAQFDTNKDLEINEKDPIFSKLVIWVDANAIGVSEPRELRPLNEWKVASVKLKHTSTQDKNGNYTLVAGNEVRLMGTFVTTSGEEKPLADIWFKQRRLNTLSRVFDK